MPANTNPIFTLVPVVSSCVIATANTHLDGTGTLGTVITGASNGTRVQKITIKSLGTTTAGMVRLFLFDGTNTRLWQEVPVTAITASATVASFSAVILLGGETALTLPNGYSLQAATEKAEGFAVIAEGGNY